MSEHTEPLPNLDVSSGLRAAFKSRAAVRLVPREAPQGYEIGGEIARGGMGVIVKAFDRDLTRDVALKVLRDELAHEPRFVNRFVEEARITARLDHPGIVPVHEAGRDPAGRPYFAMRLVRGRELRQIVELANANREGWSRTRALSVFLKVCEAMAYAHDRGVLHRDLKPSNVMVGEFGEVYVMDWGLARVIGDDDRRDLRLSERRSDEAIESPIVTMDGEVLGTPCYMSPEQAQGRIAELGPASDVYSVGAMLYHLLAGEMPYVPAGTAVAGRAVLDRLAQGPPRGLTGLRRDLPAELVAICERAMARDPVRRYPSMLAFAEDLRAYLEGRVVRAFETGAFAEARKWVQRNRALASALAAVVFALVVGLVVSLSLKAKSDSNFARAERSARIATDRADDVLSLSALQDIEDLTAESNRLWPAQPDMIPRYEAWLTRAQAKVDELPAHQAKLAALRTRAIPWTGQLLAEMRAKHPKFGELESDRRKLEHRRAELEPASSQPASRAQDVVVDFASLPTAALELNLLAWPMIDPERAQWGDESKGLAIAQRAVELSSSLPSTERTMILDTLAWALFANGRIDDALAAEERALAESEGERTAVVQHNLDELRKWIDESTGPQRLEKQKARIAELEARVAALDAEVSTRTEWTFAETQDRWWHNQLTKLIDGLSALADLETGLLSPSGISPEHGWSVQKRLDFAQTIEARSVRGPEAAAAWSRAVASIRDRSQCPLYDGLALAPQLGLIPIGRDPDSGLWEFAHLQSGEPAEHGSDGKIVMKEATGLVFVLIPGGRFQMGAQKSDPGGPNYDPQAFDDEAPVHTVTLSPFFFSKYEMTQGQWLRLTGRNPSHYGPQYYASSWSRVHRGAGLLHPVEQVSWSTCMETLPRFGLSLPNEARWEYGCRGGTSTIYWCGNDKESLQGVANLMDAFGQARGDNSSPVWETWLDDGETVHGEIGRYRANGFGLHDVYGNVFEWCSDAHVAYKPKDWNGDDETGLIGEHRMLRGGSFSSLANVARSATRENVMRDAAGSNLGLRPIRVIAR